MATWEDGPEYAPLVPPSVFTAPADAPALSYAPPAQPPTPDAPLARPDFQEEGERRPLDSYIPTRDVGRNPNEAFKVVSSTMTAVDTAWGAVHQHQVPQQGWAPPTGVPVTGMAPTEPITLSRAREAAPVPNFPPPSSAPSFPPPSTAPTGTQDFPPPGPGGPGAAGWQPAQQWSAPEQWPAPRGFGELFVGVQRSMTPAVLWALIGGCILLPFSPLLFAVAAAASGYAQHRRRWIRNIFIIGGAVIGTVAVVGLFAGGVGQLSSWWNLVSWTSLFVCLITLGSVSWLVSNAVSRGEPPEPRTDLD